MDARTARIKADLRLTPEQEKNWPGFESAVRDISKNRADRLVAFRAERAQRKESDHVIVYLKSNAKYLGERSADVKKLADAAQPLYESLDEQQKRRGVSRRPRSTRAAAFVTSREITPQLLGLLGGAVDEGVDRLAAHGPQTAFVSGFQPAGNLLGRPPFCQAVENEAP